jgi:serine/threonine-protein kinase
VSGAAPGDACEPTLPPELAARGELSRRFRIDGVVGQGGMGLVLAAHHRALDQRVALKLMRPELRARADLVGRFLREARAAARLRSPHSARILDVDTLEDGVPYLVMEYLDGVDVAALLRRDGAMAPARAATIVLHASRAIAEAHALGIIHRDLKPRNLFAVSGEELIKVLDLGVCKLAHRDELDTTATGATVGTPAYMAPEQLRAAHAADERSDLWSLGVILFELLTGTVPFHGQSIGDQCLRTTLDPVPAMPATVPAALQVVIRRCLEKQPAARFQSASELVAALEPLTRPRHAPAAPRAMAVLKRVCVALSLGLTFSGAASPVIRASASVEPPAPAPTVEPGPRPSAEVVRPPTVEAHASTAAPHASTAAPAHPATAEAHPGTADAHPATAEAHPATAAKVPPASAAAPPVRRQTPRAPATTPPIAAPLPATSVVDAPRATAPTPPSEPVDWLADPS